MNIHSDLDIIGELIDSSGFDVRRKKPTAVAKKERLEAPRSDQESAKPARGWPVYDPASYDLLARFKQIRANKIYRGEAWSITYEDWVMIWALAEPVTGIGLTGATSPAIVQRNLGRVSFRRLDVQQGWHMNNVFVWDSINARVLWYGTPEHPGNKRGKAADASAAVTKSRRKAAAKRKAEKLADKLNLLV